MATSKVQTTFRIEDEMLIKLTYIAKKNRRSLNAQLECLVEKCIEEYEQKKGEIQISEDEKHRR